MPEVINFDEVKKEYLLDGLTFTLKPPVMILKDKVVKIVKDMMNIANKPENKEIVKGLNLSGDVDISALIDTLNNAEQTLPMEKEIRKLQVAFLKLVLNGETKIFTIENLRQDFYNTVFNDFFLLFR